MILGEKKLREMYPGLDEDQYQPCSIDLKIDKIYSIPLYDGDVVLRKDGKNLPSLKEHACNDDGYYILYPHVLYSVLVDGVMTIPENIMQTYYLRSSLMRMGIRSETCVGDPGFNGRLQFTIKNDSYNYVHIQKGARFATAVSHVVDGSGVYDGQYQENKEETL